MKNINKSHIVLSLVIGLMIALGSCKKNDSTTTSTPAGNGALLFHLHTNVDTNEVDSLGQVYLIRDPNNHSILRKITVTKAQLFVSGIQVQQANGTWIAGPAVNVLKLQEIEPYTIGSLAAGNYESVRYYVGLDSVTNRTAPTVADSSTFSATMWFDNTFVPADGYVFVDFEGTIDTTANGTGTLGQMQPFVFRIGTNVNRKLVTLPIQNFTITANQATEVHMIIDYSKLFTGIQLNQNAGLIVNTAAENGSWSWAAVIANNISTASGMIYYEPGQ